MQRNLLLPLILHLPQEGDDKGEVEIVNSDFESIDCASISDF